MEYSKRANHLPFGPYSRNRKPLPRRNRFLMGGDEDDQQFKHITPLAYSSAMSRFILLNFSVSTACAVVLRLLSIQSGSCTLQLREEGFHGCTNS
jgi:hypothetical protein